MSSIIYPETNEKHSCETIHGKVWRVVIDANHNCFCNLCNKQLKITQLDKSVLRILKIKIKKMEDRRDGN